MQVNYNLIAFSTDMRYTHVTARASAIWCISYERVHLIRIHRAYLNGYVICVVSTTNSVSYHAAK
jgi:hypothetical protein